MTAQKRIENIDVWLLYLIFTFDYYLSHIFVPISKTAMKNVLVK